MAFGLITTLFCSHLGGALAFWGGGCKSDAQCEDQMQKLLSNLDEVNGMLQSKRMSVNSLDYIRSGLMNGERIKLASHQRQHLDSGNPMISQVSYDSKYAPLTVNNSQNIMYKESIATGEDHPLRHFFYLQMRKPIGSKHKRLTTMLCGIDTMQNFRVYNISGEIFASFNLGHAKGQEISKVVLSPNGDNHILMTASGDGEVRIHDVQVGLEKLGNSSSESEDKKGSSEAEAKKSGKAVDERQVVVKVNLTGTVRIPPAKDGKARELTAILPVERGSQTFYVTGDHLGGLTVFFRNGTMKGRVVVTEDKGGVKGLVKGQGQNVMFYSANHFGFFSSAQIDVQYPPCGGWETPVHMAVSDPAYSTSRVILALTNGDVLIFNTQRGKAKACDLTLKFPKVSPLPLYIRIFRGHAVALGIPENDNQKSRTRELFFLNLGAMEHGYGTSASRAVFMQATFDANPRAFAINVGAQDKSGKAQLAILPEHGKGIDLYDLSLKPPPAVKIPGAEGESNSWFSWFPKIGVFGIALIGVVMWNVRKVTSKKGGGGNSDFGDFDFDSLAKGRLGKGLGKGGLGDLGGLGLGGKKGLGGMGGLEGLGGMGDLGDD